MGASMNYRRNLRRDDEGIRGCIAFLGCDIEREVYLIGDSYGHVALATSEWLDSYQQMCVLGDVETLLPQVKAVAPGFSPLRMNTCIIPPYHCDLFFDPASRTWYVQAGSFRHATAWYTGSDGIERYGGQRPLVLLATYPDYVDRDN